MGEQHLFDSHGRVLSARGILLHINLSQNLNMRTVCRLLFNQSGTYVSGLCGKSQRKRLLTLKY